ncbi:MAG: class I mannose-6-phosphate isomerase [Clostridia bacterium]|nr:class I mannose-6-phosphate isomerase [Clostridia bacterium]
MNKQLPIKLSPAFKDYLWGGDRLKTDFGKQSDLTPLAESWELSAHRDGESTVATGPLAGLALTSYLKQVGTSALGTAAARFDYFPILIKLIDAKGDLSVQVHPDDAYALANEGEYGKTEMWYILDCEPGACLYYGFARDVSRAEYENAIKENRLTEILNRVPVKRGDVFFIPAGTVHAIGAGIVICEIQQNSNTTYRVYDYGRRDKNGNTRPLHVEKALAVSALTAAPAHTDTPNGPDVLLADCPYFTVRRLRVTDTLTLTCTDDTFYSLIVTDGHGTLTMHGETLDLSKGDSIFIPAQNGSATLDGTCELIFTHI